MERTTGFIARAFVLLGMVGAGALPASCSNKALQQPGPDGGGLEVGTDLPSERGLPFTGLRSYVVTALLQLDGGGFGEPYPASHTFTMVLDADRRTAIAGIDGRGIVASFEPTAAGALHFTGPLNFDRGCGSSIAYSDLTIAIDASDRLTGTGQGRVTVVTAVTGAIALDATMSLTGQRDDGQPLLLMPLGVDPFASFAISASEPLPPNASAALRAPDGETIALLPGGVAGSFVIQFEKPARILRYATQYQIVVDGLMDFAGNAVFAPDDLMTWPLPPQAAEDGFESVTGTTFGGVLVLSGAGEPTITGAKSLYIPPTSSPTSGLEMTQPWLAVRLALAAGDTAIRFAYRSVTLGPTSFSSTSWMLGSEGGEVGVSELPADTGATTNATIGGTAVTLGPITTASFPLPVGAANEVVLQRMPLMSSSACGHPAPLPAITGLIIDDLRVE